MNYYEELGVSPLATDAEIQKAYKALVRILHPDQQQDDRLRHLSGLQLRRLNQMAEVLADPAKRTAYDLSLSHFEPPAAAPKLPRAAIRGVRVRLLIRFNRRILAWTFIALILLASAIVSLRQPAISAASRLDPATIPTVRPTRSPDPPAVEKRIVVQHLSVSEPKRYRSVETTDFLAALPITEPQPPIGLVSSAQRDRPARPLREEEPVPISLPSPKSPPAALTGKWLYVPRDAESPTNLYPAQYIEMRIQDQGGVLRGKYYAKYKVRDRAIWPEMAFQFEGKAGDSTSVLTWSSTFGSRGELRLKRVTEESLEASWVTTEFGRMDVLASGSAILYRIDP